LVVRNAYTLMSFNSWASGSNDPYVQLLPTTSLSAAHSDFVSLRLGGQDTSADSQYALLPSDQMQHSPVSAEEKKKKYQEMVLSRWPYIFVGCLAFVLIVTGCVIWRCCCRKRRERNKAKANARNLGSSKSLGGEFPQASSTTNLTAPGAMQLEETGGGGFGYANKHASGSVMSVQTLTESHSYGKEGYSSSPSYGHQEFPQQPSSYHAPSPYGQEGIPRSSYSSSHSPGYAQQEFPTPQYGYPPPPSPGNHAHSQPMSQYQHGGYGGGYGQGY